MTVFRVNCAMIHYKSFLSYIVPQKLCIREFRRGTRTLDDLDLKRQRRRLSTVLFTKTVVQVIMLMGIQSIKYILINV